MSGKEKGVQAIIKESCPLAVYVYCSAHALNLALVKSCTIPEIYSTFDFIGDRSITSFFGKTQVFIYAEVEKLEETTKCKSLM